MTTVPTSMPNLSASDSRISSILPIGSVLPKSSVLPVSSGLSISVCYIITSALAGFGNIVILLTFATNRKLLNKNFNVLILNLATSDLAVGLLDLPGLTVQNILGYWPYSALACALQIYCDWGMTFVSIFTLVVISFDRYWATCLNASYQRYNTRRRAYIYVILIWSFMVIIFTPAFTRDRIQNWSAPTNCTFVSSANRTFMIFISFLGYHLSMCLMIFAYISVYIKLQKVHKSVAPKTVMEPQNQPNFTSTSTNTLLAFVAPTASNLKAEQVLVAARTEKEAICGAGGEGVVPDRDAGPSANGTANNAAGKGTITKSIVEPVDNKIAASRNVKELKIFKSLTLILVAYILLWTPSNICVDLECFNLGLVNPDVYNYTSLLCYFNSAVNPFLYAISNPQIQAALKQLLTGILSAADYSAWR